MNGFSFGAAVPPHGIVDGNIFIHPHLALLIFVDHDHLTADLKRTEFLVESRESHEALPQQVQHLRVGEFGEG